MLHRRIILTPFNEQNLPIFAESIGHNPEQERVVRNQGYPYVHWLQTLEGEGKVTFHDRDFIMKPHSGVMLLPDVEHSYEAITTHWQTLYLTFGGPAIPALLSSIDLNTSAYYQWEEDSPFAHYLFNVLDAVETGSDLFGIESSTYVYQFLIMLKKYGQLQKNTAINRNLKKLQPLIDWMEQHLSDPEMSIDDLAQFLDISPRYLNTLFRETFNISPYSYFLNLRLRKAKDLLIKDQSTPIKVVAKTVGFRDTSHFVATFRKCVGMTPTQFRKLY